MKTKVYSLLLENTKIGTTDLEKADAPMGVVFGQVKLNEISSGYNFFKDYCLKNGIEIRYDFPEEALIVTADIPALKVLDPNGIEIKGQSIHIEGMDTDSFEVTILGIPYPFFEAEFPHHVKAYDSQHKSNFE
jgi:hypothetical protein